MSNITLKVNGAAHTVDVEPSTPLLYILRNDLGLQGPRFGCGLGQCGACTVIVNGVATRSCITPTSAVKGEITTLEGIAKDGKLHPLQQAWIDEQVPQCGFCQNGQIMTAKALLDQNPHPTDAQIREGMDRNAVPLHDVLPHSGRHQARGKVMAAPRLREGGGRMTTFTNIPKHIEEVLEKQNGDDVPQEFPQERGSAGRQLQRTAAAGPLRRGSERPDAAAAQAAGPYPDPDFRQLDSWIVIHEDNTATFLRREDGLRAGHRNILPADDVR